MKFILKSLFWLLVLAAIGGGVFWHLFMREPPPEEIPPDQMAYEEILAFIREHADQSVEVVARFEAFLEKYPSSSYAARARQQIEAIRARQEAAIEAAWSELEQAAAGLAQTDLEVAVQLLRDYNEAFAEELKPRRDQLMRAYRQQIRAARQAHEEALKSAAARLDTLMIETGELLYAMRFAEARQKLEQAREDDGFQLIADDLEAFLAVSIPVSDMPNRVLAAYEEFIEGEPVTVQLASGNLPVRIRDVQDGRVLADRVLYQGEREIGTTPANFTFADISPQERARRLDRTPSDVNLTMLRLLLIQAKRLEQADQQLARVETVLGQLLKEHIAAELQAREAEKVPRFEPVFEPDEKNKLIVL